MAFFGGHALQSALCGRERGTRLKFLHVGVDLTRSCGGAHAAVTRLISIKRAQTEALS